MVEYTDIIDTEETTINEISITELQEAQIADLEFQLEELRIKYSSLFTLTFQSLSEDKFKDILKNTVDYNAWFEMLNIASKKYLVILTVCDTPGNHMPENILKCIVSAGFTEFRKDLWYTYIGVINKGQIFTNIGKWNEEQCFYTYETLDGSFRIWATSQSYRNGCKGDININKEPKAVNKRGVNIVVYDPIKKTIIDSVVFDSHDEHAMIFNRKN